MWDLSTIGREIGRPWGVDWQMQASQQVAFVPAMLTAVPADAGTAFTLAVFARKLAGVTLPTDPDVTTGCRVFPVSDYTVHTRPAWMVTTRMASSRTERCEVSARGAGGTVLDLDTRSRPRRHHPPSLPSCAISLALGMHSPPSTFAHRPRHAATGPLIIRPRPRHAPTALALVMHPPLQCINGENLLGAHLSDGAMWLTGGRPNGSGGYEYVDTMPAWNWGLLPGTTVVPLPPPSAGQCWYTGGMGTTAFVGAASDGIRGSVAWDYEAPFGWGLSYKRLVALLEDRYVVALGAVATAGPSAARPVYSAVAQHALVPGDVVFTSAAPSTPLSDQNGTAPAGTWWVWAAGAGYIFPDLAGANGQGLQLWIGVGQQSGNWSAVGAYGMNGAVSARMFTLWLAAPPPVTSGAWSYAVFPNISAAAFAASAADLLHDTALLRNDAGAQAVWSRNASLGAFAAYACDP
jgi:hypothetical protein